MSPKQLSQTIQNWYAENQRPLPWRLNKDPYRIWISEVMLQQTTVAAVVPYYERFLTKFPRLEKLATAEQSEVLQMWAGLGYYSRARNLHHAAQTIHKLGKFPQTYTELLELKGFGPYTARAVASLAFDQKVGVLDGNVIRFLSRLSGERIEWWTNQGRQHLQKKADELAQFGSPSQLNQALMEMGATICTPTSPACLLCPLTKQCEARKQDSIEQLPLKKPRRKSEIWIWQPEVQLKQNKIALVQNNYAPFLKGQWIPPGKAIKSKTRPRKFDLQHSITHHSIYIQIMKPLKSKNTRAEQWIHIDELSKINPSSLLQKVLSHL